MAGKPPEVRAIVDVEDHLRAIGLGDADRLLLRGFGVRLGKMRAGDEHGAGGLDEILAHVVFADRHVGAVFAVEDGREGLVVFNAEQHESREPRRIGLDSSRLHALAGQMFLDEGAHLLVADAGDDR